MPVQNPDNGAPDTKTIQNKYILKKGIYTLFSFAYSCYIRGSFVTIYTYPMLRFKQLWQVDFMHQYYTLRPYQPFRVFPTPSTARHLQAYGLLMKSVARGFSVILKSQDAATDAQYLLQEPIKLVFTITCDDPLLLNFSDLSPENITQSFFLSNEYEAIEGKTYLHADRQLSGTALMMPVTDYNALDAYFKNEDSITCYLRNKVYFTGTYEAFKASQTFENLLDTPYFSVQVADQPNARSFYAWAHTTRNLFAILEMTLTPAMVVRPAPAHYVVNIGARSISWRYNIIENPQRLFSDFTMYAGKQVLSLKPITTRTLSDGSTAIILEPVDPILLAETYDTPFEVEFNQTDSKAGKLSSRRRLGLPIPDIERIKISAQYASAYSDMYIHI
jgi:hypothetical protein